MSASMEDYFNALGEATRAVQEVGGGKVRRCKNPQGVAVWAHVALSGTVTEVPVSGDALRDLNILRMLVTPLTGETN